MVIVLVFCASVLFASMYIYVALGCKYCMSQELQVNSVAFACFHINTAALKVKGTVHTVQEVRPQLA